MSEKQAKLQRNSVISQIVISVLGDGRVAVSGFPTNFNMAMRIMNAGVARVAQHFVTKARNGEVDEGLTLNDSKIIRPNVQVVIDKNKLH